MMGGYLRSLRLRREEMETLRGYPFDIPAIAALAGMDTLEIHPQITYFIGENGSGKSTLLEALAVALGFNAEGGSRNFRFSTYSSTSCLHEYLALSRGPRRPRDGYFLRAESLYNVATEIEALDEEPGFDPPVKDSYGGSLHARSHGESFLDLVTHRLGGRGLYLFDEPEAALSPQRQLAMLLRMDELCKRDSQLIVATHSPILLAYPHSSIYEFNEKGIAPIRYEDSEPYRLTSLFLRDYKAMLQRLEIE